MTESRARRDAGVAVSFNSSRPRLLRMAVTVGR